MEVFIKFFLRKFVVKKISKLVTSFVFLSLFASNALAQTSGLPQGWESYLDRPDILALHPQPMQNPGSAWDQFKAAHFSFIAFLLEAYPADTKIYFLARDSEHLYDVARLVTKGTKEADRFHLLNVSRANMRDQNLLPYLKQNGISPEGLRKGEKVLFVDTGFAGTIPRVIGEAFPEDVRGQLKTHLLVSSNPEHPSSRTFLINLNPMANETSPTEMHGSIVSYEYMARYTDRSSKYLLVNGVYHPISPINPTDRAAGLEEDGAVSKEKSESYMRDLIASWNNPQTRAQFQFEREQARWFHRALLSGADGIEQQIKERLQIENKAVQKIAEAQVRDFYEAAANSHDQFKIQMEDLGLSRLVQKGQNFSGSKKNELIKKFPEWAPILENPNDHIADLFKKGNWQMIGNLIDANVDMEINLLIAKGLFDASATGIKKDLQVLMIEKSDSKSLASIAEHIFSQSHTKNMTDLLKLMIEKKDNKILRSLATYVFSQPHTKDAVDLIKLALVSTTDSYTSSMFYQDTFSKPHTKTAKYDILRKVFDIGNIDEKIEYLNKNYVYQDVLKKSGAEALKVTNLASPQVIISCKALFL
jgi:hypothetical protein